MVWVTSLPHDPYGKKKQPTLGDGTRNHLRAVLTASSSLRSRSRSCRLSTCLFHRSRGVSAHAADFVWEHSVWNSAQGRRCQLTPLKELYQHYWILSLIWLAITLRLLLTTVFSVRWLLHNVPLASWPPSGLSGPLAFQGGDIVAKQNDK